jgi:enterochelin esterase-like enzyme
MKKIFVLLSLALALASCINGNGNEPNKPENPEGTEQNTPVEPEKPAEPEAPAVDENGISLKKSPKAVTTGKLYRTKVKGETFTSNVNIDIWVPDCYNPEEKYPVLYLHDGQNLYDAKSSWNKQAWEIDQVGGKLIEEGKIKPFIAVGIHSIDATRVCDLMPEKVLTEYFDHEKYTTTGFEGYCSKEIRGDEYVDLIVNTIKPMIDSTFSTLPDKDNTAIMGSSMGGLASFYAMCERPDIFGTAICVSTHMSVAGETCWAEAVFAYLRAKLPTDGEHKIYFDCGDKTSDYYYVPFFDELVSIPQEKGYTVENGKLSYGFYPGTAHDEASWCKRVDVPLTFLYKK